MFSVMYHSEASRWFRIVSPGSSFTCTIQCRQQAIRISELRAYRRAHEIIRRPCIIRQTLTGGWCRWSSAKHSIGDIRAIDQASEVCSIPIVVSAATAFVVAHCWGSRPGVVYEVAVQIAGFVCVPFVISEAGACSCCAVGISIDIIDETAVNPTGQTSGIPLCSCLTSTLCETWLRHGSIRSSHRTTIEITSQGIRIPIVLGNTPTPTHRGIHLSICI